MAKFKPKTKDELQELIKDASINLGDIDVSNITDMSCLFCQDKNGNEIIRIDFSGIENWDVSNVTDMSYMFDNCLTFNKNISCWDVGNVTRMIHMFECCKIFNQPLNSWNVSKVTDMKNMFYCCYAFNQSLDNWNVSKVTDMQNMFYCCYSFNQSLSSWNVSNVEYMRHMFHCCHNFNQPLNSWNVSNVEYMECMFYRCYAFNQPLDSWDVSKVRYMNHIFNHCHTFNQTLNDWNVSRVEDMSEMFKSCYILNQPLGNWDVSNVTNMNGMFKSCYLFDQPLEKWNVSKATDMSYMFAGCRSFNQSLNGWNIDKLTSMGYMFYSCYALNQSFDNWDIDNVTDVEQMFANCKSLDQDFSSWSLKKAKYKDEMFKGSLMEKKVKFLPSKPKKTKESYTKFNQISELEISFEAPQKALKFLCYALSNENIVAMWHNEKSFYESGELKSISFIDYLNEEKGQKYRNVYEFSKERDLLSFESICGDVISKITEINYAKNKVSGKIELAKKDDFKKIKEFFELLKRDDNALAMMYKNDSLTKKALLKGKYSLYSGDADYDFEDEPKVNSYMTFEYDEFGVLKTFGIDEEIQENPGTTCCAVDDNGCMEVLQFDYRLSANIYTSRESEDLIKCEIKDDIALVEMREFNKDKLKNIFGEYECDEKGDIKSFENKDFCLKEVFLKYAFDLCSDESEYYEEKANKIVKKGKDKYELCGYKLVDDVCDEFEFLGAYISKMMTFEVPVKYLSRIEKLMIEKSCIFEEGEIALSKAILMF